MGKMQGQRLRNVLVSCQAFMTDVRTWDVSCPGLRFHIIMYRLMRVTAHTYSIYPLIDRGDETNTRHICTFTRYETMAVMAVLGSLVTTSGPLTMRMYPYASFYKSPSITFNIHCYYSYFRG